MRKNTIKVCRHGSGNWREGQVLDRRGESLYVDFNGTFDWVSPATHEIIWI